MLGFFEIFGHTLYCLIRSILLRYTISKRSHFLKIELKNFLNICLQYCVKNVNFAPNSIDRNFEFVHLLFFILDCKELRDDTKVRI